MDAVRKPKLLRDASQPTKFRGNSVFQNHHRKRVPNGKWIAERILDDDQKSVIRESTGVKNVILQDWLTYNRKAMPMTDNYDDTVISSSKDDHFIREIKALDCISNLVSSTSSINRWNERRKKDGFSKNSARLHQIEKSVGGQKTINFDDEIWPTCPKLFNSEELLAKHEAADLPDDQLLGDFMVHPLPSTDLALFRSSITSAKQYDQSCWNEKILEPTREADCGNDVPAASETVLNRDTTLAKPISAKTRATTANHGQDPGKRDELQQKTIYEISVPPDYVSPLGAPPTTKLQPVLRERIDPRSKQDNTSVPLDPDIKVIESIPTPWIHAQRPLRRSRSKKPKTHATSLAVEIVNDATIHEEHAERVRAESKESWRFDCLEQTGKSSVCDEPMITKKKINRDKIRKPAGIQPAWKPAGHNRIRSNPNILPKHVTRHGDVRRKGIRRERSPREGKAYRRARPAGACLTSDSRRLSNSFGLQLHRSLARMNMKAKEYQSDSMFLRRSRTQISRESNGTRATKSRLKARTRSRSANETKVPELPSPSPEALRNSSALGSLKNNEREELSSTLIADALKELLDLENEHSTMSRTSTTVARCSIVVHTVESEIIEDLDMRKEKAEQVRVESASPCELASEGSTPGFENPESNEGIPEVLSESVDCQIQESCRPEEERHDSSVDCSSTDLLASWNEALAEESSLPLTSHFGCIVDLSSEDSIGRSTTTGLSKASLASTTMTDRTQKTPRKRKSMKDSSTLTTASQTASNESSSQSGKTLATTSEQFHPHGGSSTTHQTTPEAKYFERRAKSLHLLKKILSDQGMDTRLLVRAERKLKQKRSMGRRCIASSRSSLQMDQPSSNRSRVVIDKGTSTPLFRNIDASSNTKSVHLQLDVDPSMSRLQCSEENREAKTIVRNKSGSSMPSLEEVSGVSEKCIASSDPPKLHIPADILEAFRVATIRAANLCRAVQILDDHRCRISEDTSVIDSSSSTTFRFNKKKLDAKPEFKDDKAAVNRPRTVGIPDESVELRCVQVKTLGKSSGTVLTSKVIISHEQTVPSTSESDSYSRRGQTEQPVQMFHSSNLPNSISSVANADERTSESKKVSMLSDGIETLHFAGRQLIENNSDDGSRVDEAPTQILQPQAVSRIKELLTKNLEHFKSDLHQTPSCFVRQCDGHSCSSEDETPLSWDQAGSRVPEWCQETDGRSGHHAKTMSIHNYLSEATKTTNRITEVNQQCGLRKPQPQSCPSDKGLQTLKGTRKFGHCTGKRAILILDQGQPNMTNKLMFFREHILSIIYGTICLAVFWCLRFSLHCEV